LCASAGGDAVDLVDLIYGYIKAEKEKHKREAGVIWVSDLVRCPLKRMYEERFPEIALSEMFRPSLVLGTLLHKGLEELLRNLLREYVVQTEVEGSKEVLLESGETLLVRGRVDMLLSRGEERVAVEIKTSRSDRSIPQRHHIDQVRAYNWLLDLDRSVLLYVTPDRVTQFCVGDRMSDSEVASIVVSKKAPRYSWECSYCPYSVVCPSKVVV
jgi:CRISPR-associated exonuclease Cas4